ncbi:TetR/AcrR family transcriptional regulator [Treponema rectale]|uniref:TetR/AcrR family transcriptional regulator n=1 Tax=Treponema rectale TaxID=744512 RepID=A0A7M1XLX8_9SPIR|nr:TetR/AcrR family transcriptional regulator [Treponema rectale]
MVFLWLIIINMKKEITGLKLSNEEINRITKDSIQEALVYLLSKKDIDDISVTEIVNKAGVSRTAYYRNYQSKEDILKDFSMNVFNLIFSQLDREDFAKDPKNWYRFIFTQIKNNARIVKLVVKARLYTAEEFLPKSDLTMLSINEQYQIFAMESALVNLIQKWVEEDFVLSVEEMTELCFKLFPGVGLFMNHN